MCLTSHSQEHMPPECREAPVPSLGRALSLLDAQPDLVNLLPQRGLGVGDEVIRSVSVDVNLEGGHKRNLPESAGTNGLVCLLQVDYCQDEVFGSVASHVVIQTLHHVADSAPLRSEHHQHWPLLGEQSLPSFLALDQHNAILHLKTAASIMNLHNFFSFGFAPLLAQLHCVRVCPPPAQLPFGRDHTAITRHDFFLLACAAQDRR
mmetsp:Transcript_46474/g.129283  ORF Transcript_46474/g.129283 Transcript_46474/m.129283 type:complete len:206 (-) Transcript_46474:37-654(-)